MAALAPAKQLSSRAVIYQAEISQAAINDGGASRGGMHRMP